MPVATRAPSSTATDARRNITDPASTTLDAGLSYSWTQGGMHLKHSLRVSVKNATDKNYYTPNFGATDRRAFFIAYTLSH